MGRNRSPTLPEMLGFCRRDALPGIKQATVKRSGGSSVKNVSAAGFLIDTPLAIGAVVRVQLPPLGSARAQVRWSLGTRSGQMFIKRDGRCLGCGVAASPRRKLQLKHQHQP